MLPRCPKTKRRCNATGLCVRAVTEKNAAPYVGADKRRGAAFRCKRGSRQCANRVCYRNEAFERGAEANAATVRNRAVRRFVEVRRTAALKNAAIVLLGMSHERLSDRVRIVELLKQYRYVVGVSVMRVPADPAAYRELQPYAASGRYQQVEQNFKSLKVSTARKPNTLLELLRDLRERVAEIDVCLDYFFLQHPYYNENYGTNWFVEQGREGKLRKLLDHATSVFLPVDGHGVVQEMVDGYNALPTRTMRVDPVPTTPLHSSDRRIEHIPEKPSADQNVARYLNVTQPFLRITSIK